MKNIIRKTLVFSLLLLMTMNVFLLTGCQNTQNTEQNTKLYYLNIEGTALKSTGYELEDKSPADQAMSMLKKLAEDPKESELRRLIPGNVTVNAVNFSGYSLQIDLSKEYLDMQPTNEILVRAGIVKSLIQIPKVSYVSFTIDGDSLLDNSGNQVGSLNADSFVENPGEQINSSIETKLNLYFASEDGTHLVKETRTVHHSSNISLEKLIMEQLIEGPKTSGLQQTIPAQTKLINLSVADGICYVNLTEAFSNQNEEITEQVVLYSIVDSLTDLDNIDKVQISVNGDSSGKCRYNYDLSTMYEADLSIASSNAVDLWDVEDTE